jgi:hypothetical protein
MYGYSRLAAVVCCLCVSLHTAASQRCQATNASSVDQVKVRSMFDSSQINYTRSVMCPGSYNSSTSPIFSTFPGTTPTAASQLWKLYSAVWVNCSYPADAVNIMNAFLQQPIGSSSINLYASSYSYPPGSLQDVIQFPGYGIAVTNCGLVSDNLTTVFKLYKQALGNTTFDFNLSTNNITDFSLSTLLSYCSSVRGFDNDIRSSIKFTRRPTIGLLNLSHNLIGDISTNPQTYSPLSYMYTNMHSYSSPLAESQNDVVQSGLSVNKLDLSFNSITSEYALRALCNVNGLLHLHLQNNDIDSFGCVLNGCLASLTLLDLSNNRLTVLCNRAFSATLLAYVDLSNNHLTTVQAIMFPSTLRTLLLQNNNIASLALDEWLPILPSIFIDLHGNPVDCCSMRWFMSALATYDNYPSLLCQYPAGVSLAEVANSGCQPASVTSVTLNSDAHTVQCSYSGSDLALNATIVINDANVTAVDCPSQSGNTSTYIVCAPLQQDAAVTTVVCAASNLFYNSSMQLIVVRQSVWRVLSVGELVGSLVAVCVLTAVLAVILTLVITHYATRRRNSAGDKHGHSSDNKPGITSTSDVISSSNSVDRRGSSYSDAYALVTEDNQAYQHHENGQPRLTQAPSGTDTNTKPHICYNDSEYASTS